MINIFDGELIVDRHQPKIPIFLVFDALLTAEFQCMFMKFRDRLHFAANEVRERYRKAQALAEINPHVAQT